MRPMSTSEPMIEFKSQGLPVVSAKTLDAIFQVYAGQKWGKNLEKVRDRLIADNPHLIKFIESQVSKYPREMHTPMFEVILGAISILEHQAQLDNKRKKI